MNLEIKELPKKSGIYIFKDSKEKIIYIGKAKSLKDRVGSYFKKVSRLAPKNETMVSKVSRVDYVVTKNELEALILESNFIKKHKPRYNILLRDDKHFPYLRLSVNETFPELKITRRALKDGALYFGPYTPAGALKGVIRQLYKIFPLRKCRHTLSEASQKRPCLNFQIGRCKAPCSGKISKEDYSEIVRGVVLFLKGKNFDLIKLLTQKMKNASESLCFEEAANYRDQILSVKKVMQRQEIISTSIEDQDVISCVGEKGGEFYIQMIYVRGGKITGSRDFPMKTIVEKESEDIIYEFLKQYYGQKEYIPDEIIVKDPLKDQDLLKEWFFKLKNSPVRLTTPKQGRKLSLIKMATENARQSVLKKSIRIDMSVQTLHRMKNLFKLEKTPRHIEAFDISNIQGQMAVGSMVVFREGKPASKDYRRYRINSIQTPDDYQMVREVISRRYLRVIHERLDLPDLILIDGGKGQLMCAKKVLKELQLGDIDVLGIAKGKDRNDRETDEVFCTNNKRAVIIDPDSDVKLLLQRIRDEAHRFAITYHRTLRGKSISSELEKIPGIGKKIRVSLLKYFGSVKKIKVAGLEQLKEVSGINSSKAESIYNYFHGAM